VTRLEENLRAVRARIDAAARAAGRDPADVRLVAISKTWPADDVRALAALGQVDFGENRVQELAAKAAAVGDLPVRWHFVGQLQRNKAASVAALGAVVHSVDRPSLAGVLDRAGQQSGVPVDVLVQVDLGGPEGELAARGGAAPDDVPALADRVADAPGLRLLGLMAVAPRGVAPGPAFVALAGLAERVRADHPEARELSAGMSADLDEAVAAGATLVRVGTAIFGDRPLPCDGSGQQQARESHPSRGPREPLSTAIAHRDGPAGHSGGGGV
jgi:pyridoxal phosphate enzyme (YggS family)